MSKVGPGLPAMYDIKEPEAVLPESPFEEMTPGHYCVQLEGFKYQGRIIIPKSSERRSTAGRIVDGPPDAKYPRGTRILFSQFAGYMFNFKGAVGMRIMGESEILGKLKEEVEVLEDEG